MILFWPPLVLKCTCSSFSFSLTTLVIELCNDSYKYIHVTNHQIKNKEIRCVGTIGVLNQ